MKSIGTILNKLSIPVLVAALVLLGASKLLAPSALRVFGVELSPTIAASIGALEIGFAAVLAIRRTQPAALKLLILGLAIGFANTISQNATCGCAGSVGLTRSSMAIIIGVMALACAMAFTTRHKESIHGTHA